MKKVFLVILAFVLIIILFNTSQAERKTISVNINYPGIGIRYLLSEKIGAELKAQTEIGATVIGARVYYLMNEKFGIHPLYGIEFDTLTFKGEVSEGSGMALALFVGAESYLTESLSLQLDFGPAMIMLSDDSTSVSDTGTEIVINIGINWYFGKEL
jgi:hypothetical protein